MLGHAEPRRENDAMTTAKTDQAGAEQGWGDRLAEAHRMLRGFVAEAVRAAVQEDLGPSATLTEQMKAHCETACFYLHGHHDAENGMIFPHLVQVRPDLEGTIDRLLDEHRVIAERLADVEAAVQDGDPPALAARLERLSNYVEAHFEAEEGALVDALNALTGPVPWDE